MPFSLPDHWVWDFWTVVDQGVVHLYYLHAPRSLGDPELRHRHAAIGHATSIDWSDWTDHGSVLGHGRASDPDASATWTGSVFREPGGRWRMFYTGSRFLDADSLANIETIMSATSEDLFSWRKDPSVALAADTRWYEALRDGTWPEEAWRDPWIAPDPAGVGWHMLLTARARDGAPGSDPADRGVIGHAFSTDLVQWQVRQPLSVSGSGFAHLEVPQTAQVAGREVLVFSCAGTHLVGPRAGEPGGVWAVPTDTGNLLRGAPVDVSAASRVTGEELYAGRVVHTAGGPALIGFENVLGEDGDEFGGMLSDPLPLVWVDGQLRLGSDA